MSVLEVNTLLDKFLVDSDNTSLSNIHSEILGLALLRKFCSRDL